MKKTNMKKIEFKGSLTECETRQLILLIVSKLKLEFSDKEIPDSIKKHFKKITK